MEVYHPRFSEVQWRQHPSLLLAVYGYLVRRHADLSRV